MGNFTVWPGSHRILEKYFQNHEPDPDLKFGIPPVELSAPIQLKVKAGDLVIAHYQLAHTAASNLSKDVRYAIYIRMHHAHYINRKILSTCLGIFENIGME